MASKEISGVLLVFVMILLMSLIPVIAVSTQDSAEVGITQNEAETAILQSDYFSTLNNITASNDVNITVFYNDTSFSSDTKNLSLSETKTFTVNSEDIDITYSNQIDNETVFLTYSYSTYLGWPDGAENIIKNAPIFLVSIVILLIIVLIFTIFGQEDK